MRVIIINLALLILFSPLAYSQPAAKKELKALRITEKPKIDGKLTEECWQTAPGATDFVQYEPYNGAAPTFQTVFRIVYDDNSIYIGVVMYDNEPEKIMRELGPRDSEELNADAILVSISPYNDGLNSLDFLLYASGVQLDNKAFSTGEDISWDAVWKSEVNITEEGWVAELEIPYSALRFPKTDIQQWGLNMIRENRRIREISTWNFIDKKIDGIVNQAGILNGIEQVKPPLRLSFEPYLSSTVRKEPDATSWDAKFNGGMDLKYGLSESFTLDMTLIPDFSQVPSDDQVVNLGPFETYYSEKRQFFTEGVELFSRGDVFYSRRVGSKPMGYDDIEEQYPPENIIENPEQTQLLNATKLSGRTSTGTGIGVFNAMTAPSYATIQDSTGDTPEIQTQPFTNYSMLVADQSLPNKSYISLYNTNVYRGTDEYTANVTGTQMEFRDRRNIFSASGLFNLSQKYYPDKPADLGYTYEVTLFKISGNFKYAIFQEVITDTYDPNDLGYLQMNNEIENGIYFSY
ncbi:MAG: carbohydrate binding family 9 domain-containing protein, partial [Bacteroidales bacterium]|nr:carbohydrate binding family 9 domain-containing protein [Bacteroidales bacterium]